MFKKTLVAAALSVAAFGAQAAVVAPTGGTAGTISLEGSAGDANGVALTGATVTLGAQYTVGDTITFNISGAEFDATNSTPALAATLAGGDTATFGLLSIDKNSITFRITAQADGGADGVNYTGGTVALTGISATTASVVDAAGDVKLTFSAKTSNGLAIDNTGTLTATVDAVVAQFTGTVTKSLNGIVDVNNARQQFTAADEGATADDLVITLAEAVAATNDAVYTGAVYVVKGDFSWMETDGDDGIDAGELAAAFSVAAGGDDTFASTINASADEITVTATDGGANTAEAATMTFTVAGVGEDNAVLPLQNYTVDATAKYNTAAGAAATKAVLTDAAAGAWTLNGSVVEVPYLPFSPLTQPILRHTNSGAQSGDITARYMVEGVHTQWQSLGTLVSDAAPGVRNLLSPVNTALKAAGYDSATDNFKIALEVTTNVPENDVAITAGAKIDNQVDVDRLSLGVLR